jgi:hypothetical protein
MTIQNIAIQHYVFGTTRNILAGAGLCYSIQNEKYLEIPLTILFPSIYAGYHIYKNNEKVVKWVKNISR